MHDYTHLDCKSTYKFDNKMLSEDDERQPNNRTMCLEIVAINTFISLAEKLNYIDHIWVDLADGARGLTYDIDNVRGNHLIKGI